MRVEKALILAGGEGKRLRPLTEKIPKSLVEILGKPIIAWQIELLKKYGVGEIVVAVGRLKEKIIDYLGGGSRFGVKIMYTVEEEKLGTGGAIKNAENILRDKEAFFVLNGDIITNLNLDKIIETAEKHPEYYGYLALIPLRSTYGIVPFDEKYTILEFREKPVLYGYWMNAGIYLFGPQVFEYLPKKGDIERMGFPELAKDGKLRAVTFEKGFYWKSIDTHNDVEEAEKMLKQYFSFSTHYQNL